MRTKLFLAFFAVIFTALISNLIFERLIMSDFEDYVKGSKEDRLYWVLASVEGSYSAGRWDMRGLHESVHWAMMLGFDVEVEDAGGEKLVTAHMVHEGLPEPMKSRMEGLTDLSRAKGHYERYPLYIKGAEIGSLLVRPIEAEGPVASGKELIFKKRGRDFLIISFLIAGGGALFLGAVFSIFLSRPVRRLRQAAEAVAGGSLDVNVPHGGKDELGKLSEAFNRMLETLRREEALRRHLTSNIAHELRTPLAVMRANLEAMLDGVITDQREGLKTIQAELKRLTDLIEGIENLTKAEASFFKEAHYERVPLREFLEGITQGLSPLFHAKNLSLSLRGEEEMEVETDVEKLEAAIRNILANSLRHTEQGGVEMSYGGGKKEFFISVKDTGEGIPEEELPMIFKRFFRGAGSEGVGLGLAIAKELVELMGGSIGVQSSVGKGTTFTVTLPLKKASI